MSGHDWKRVSFQGELQAFSRALQGVDTSTPRVWHCAKCGSIIRAEGGMKLRDARRRARIPFDCDQQIVDSVHEY